ncbi:MAG: bifunctional hydroxymethylpyrimidine kinase/phosphomethylpyrimidine kinase [Lachnospiraceae bacterium]|nr:bifunctional hydroxymethylpyrimidine kinase/phosphomethylpyrimidine kinase [Lachnospiraceae bacterium]MEE3460862.1 bifunctional hydroxymethylpyrimidine kinase/phosphomethylpyrimidine kinase [Lachnospiraceae bacterium]
MRKVLTIAGSDSSGGAGIQADLKTIAAHGLYGMSVITGITAQNTMGVSKVMNCPGDLIAAQLDAVFTDIRPDAVKTGLLPSAESICVIAEKLKEYHVNKLVVDPVITSTSGHNFLTDSVISTMQEKLFPLALLITPNIPEGQIISGIKIMDRETMKEAAKEIGRKFKVSVLLKGGHLAEIQDKKGTADNEPDTTQKSSYPETGRGTQSSDLLYIKKEGNELEKLVWFDNVHIDNPDTHGTGCTLSSAICCGLASGMGLTEAVNKAKEYVTGAISAGLHLGHGAGPLDHMYEYRQ